ncbi:MAG: replicative DNA helicase, partial [Bacteroidales bacterium]|nr:replicative DNA helicase [Bacteroidales bacterium]
MENLFSKKPPYDEKLEQIVLGSIIIEPSEFAQVMSQFRPETFYKESHKLIAKSLLKMAKANKAIDMMTVVEQLAADGVLEKVGGAFYVASLSENIGSAAHLEMHLRILIQKEIRRKIIEKASDLFNKSFDESVDLDDLLNDTSKLIDWVSKEVIKQEGETVREIQPNVIQKIEKAAQNGNGISGITSGFPSIDRITQGWQNSDMVVIAARPSMGKTAFSLSMACNIAALGIPCAFFSLEMSKEQIVQRILSMETGINSKQIRSGQLSTDEWQHLENFVTPIEGMPIVIDDQAAMKTLDFRTKA